MILETKLWIVKLVISESIFAEILYVGPYYEQAYLNVYVSRRRDDLGELNVDGVIILK
jgi:hypothetical protein